jgi:hypothetical protein
MSRNIILVFAVAALLGAGYFASDALARGGGGGGRGGGHGGMSMGSGWRGPAMHGGHTMFGHMSRSPFKGQHAHGMQNFGRNMNHRSMHDHSLAQGQWHSLPGFGSHGHQKWANMQGVWHKVPGFGRRGQINKTRDFRRDWQASGDAGWVAGVSLGDLCAYTGTCQGVWQVVPQPSSSSPAAQSRKIKRDWQVGEEL